MKKIAIFGATGMTGVCVVNIALEKGYTVTLLVRDISRVPEEHKNNPNVKLVVGDVTILEDVQKTVSDNEGVVVTLGTRGNLNPTTDLSDGVKNILTAMKEHNVKAISACFSAFLFYELDKVPPQFHALNDEHRRMYELLKASEEINWIAVMPPHISEAPTSKYIIKHGEHPGPRVISKFDLATFLIDSLDMKQHHKKSIGIANEPMQIAS